MTTTEPLQVLVAESDLSDPALALGLIKKGHTCKAFECNADDPHKIGYYLHLTSSAALTGGIPAATCGRAVGSRFTGPATRKPPRAATACPAAVPHLVVRVSAWFLRTASRYHSALIFEGRWSGVSSPCLQVGVSTPQS